MNNTQTCEKLRAMRLQAMAELHEQHLASNQHTSMTTDEYLDLLTDHQWEARQHQKTNRLLKQAHFKQRTTLQEINYSQLDISLQTVPVVSVKLCHPYRFKLCQLYRWKVCHS